MGWIDMLEKTYDACGSLVGIEKNEDPVLLPIAHSTANAQIEVTIDLDGNFIRELSGKVEKNGRNEITIIPVTEGSASRGAGNFPHALCDKLCYAAGDFSRYTGETKEEYFQTYLKGLKKWAESEYSHPWIQAVYVYEKKGSLISDLISAGLLKLDETGVLSETENKIHQLAQRDAFVRFAVYADGHRNELWKSQELYNLYVQFYVHSSQVKKLCYVSGQMEICTDKHPSKIRNTGDKAKLISGNDETGFTYRGRFENKEEAVSVSYQTSQKAHNALRWLLQKQGYTKDGSAVVVWKLPGQKEDNEFVEEMLEVPDIFGDSMGAFRVELGEEGPDGEEQFGAEDELDTGNLCARLFNQALAGYAGKFKADDKVVMMAVDAATTGRLSITYYHEFAGNDFINHVIHWHQTCTWYRCVKLKKSGKHVWVNSAPSPREIALAAYGTERESGFLDCDAKLLKGTVQRILPCIVGLSRKIPVDIVHTSVIRASNPQAYSTFVWRNQVLAVACAMIKYNHMQEGRGNAMELNQDRSTLFGRLLAIMEYTEQSARYVKRKEDNREEDRLTNAKKLWNIYTRRPAITFERLHSKMIQSYVKNLPVKKRTYLENEMMHLTNALRESNNFNNNPLKEEYLLGYYAQREMLLMKKEKETDDEGGNE